MSDNTNDRLTEIVDAAFGEGDGSVVRSGDRAKLSQFTKMAKSLKGRFYDAPEAAVARAKSLVPKPERRSLTVRLLRTTIALAGVRLESGQEQQALFDAEGVKIRVMYAHTNQGIEIAGKIEGDGWTASCAGQDQACSPDGRFEFSVPDVVHTGLDFWSPTSEIHLPKFEELAPHDEGLDRPH